ncbi:hypothetical protein SAMN05421820_101378 [Pedobacter steynii]|uniref:Uncharacterized protein n=2 Tax=Pedobacter steynii TaxID=430522 RepID=A0A1G9JUW5_9SPHI|nr:hypothetical protein [Pedobacter steynii]NQX38361.1 hypothetical protein [Pedobacter steynii]SDL41182.1 hypothetical protein SAMN05421820_101378 [Pedobacter steynii]
MTWVIASNAQTNTFPPMGNAGIGTVDPKAKLSFNNLNDGSDGPDGITWYSPDPLHYGIHRTEGAWTQPNYQQLRLVWDTGIILNPGTLYGKSYVDIQGAGLRVTSGNIGIGTINPLSKFHVQADANTSGAPANSQVLIGGTTNPEKRLSLAYNTSSNYAELQSQAYTGSYTAIILNPNGGNVGIGTNNPSAKLAVEGNIKAREIKVESTVWPDYVFDKDYQLPTLKEIEKHIQEKGHLPGIPSAKEVKENGIELGEMNAKLLQKIEELTLHLIEKDKQLNKVNAVNNEYGKRLQDLESKINLLLVK